MRAVVQLPLSRGDFENADSWQIEQLVRSEDWRSSTFLHSAGRVHDPIFTPLFTAIGFTGTVTIGTSTITTAAIASAIATTALSIGIQMLMTPKPPKPDDGKVPVTQAIPYRMWVVGTTRMAGALMLWEAKGPALYSVQAIAGHGIDSFNRFWLHDDEVTGHIGGDGFTTYGDMPYRNNVRILTRKGLATETAYSEIVNGYTQVPGLGPEGIWTVDHRGDGTASVAMICSQARAKDQQSMFPYGAPRITVEVNGTHVWDFRDGSQNPDDPSTWGFSKNSALILCWHLCFNPYGERKDYRMAILPVLDMWVEEANICDEDVERSVASLGGTFKRYECSGWDTTEHDPKVGTNAILSTCDGWICYRGDGAILLTVGKFRESRVVTITDSDIMGYQIQRNVLPQDECNRLVPKFTYPDSDYSESDTDFWESVPDQILVGRVLIKEGDYRWSTNWIQARMLGRRDWLRLQQKIRGSLDVRLSGLNAIYARWVRLSTPLGMPRYNGMVIENRKSVLALTKGGFSMDFIKHPDNIDAWDAATMEGQKPPVPEKPAAADLNAPTISSILISAPQTGSVSLIVTVNDPNDASLGLSLWYRLHDTGGGSPGEWSSEQKFEDFTASGGFITVTSSLVPTDTNLDVQAAWHTSRNKYSDRSNIYTVATVSDPTAPGAVSDVDVVGGSGQAAFGWRAPNSANYRGAKIYLNTTGDFSTSTFQPPIEVGGANGIYSVTRTIAVGSYFAWITAVNVSGVESAPTPTGPFVVTS